jgi:hypothetical protein
MDHFKQEKTYTSNKLGFHYFLDAERFKQEDASLWINKLKEIGAKWLVVSNPHERAIPEDFIRSFSRSGINLVVNLNQQLNSQYVLKKILPLLQVYGKWGLKYACLFEKPNIKSSWGEIEWNKQNIVETHLDKFIQFAQTCTNNNIKPIFSPLFPGGDYWDLAFLEESLKGLALKASPKVLNNIVLSAFGWTFGHSIEWGAGGKKKWINSKPFTVDQNAQDQKGFRTYEWYLEISKKVLGVKLPIFIFEAGKNNGNDNEKTLFAPDNLAIVPNLLSGENIFNPQKPTQLLSPIPKEVLGCFLFILSASQDQNYFPYRWFESAGEPLEIAMNFGAKKNVSEGEKDIDPYPSMSVEKEMNFKHRRYILIMEELQNNMPILLEKLDAYIREFKPQIGFSQKEALNSAYILAITENKERNVFGLEDGNVINSVVKVITPEEISTL